MRERQKTVRQVPPFGLPSLPAIGRERTGIFHFDPRTGPPRRGKFGLPQDRQAPGGRPPTVLLYAVFATHPQRGEYSRPPLAPAVIAPQYRYPRGEGWRVPQSSPASLWEGVSKFHNPPRCRRARPAKAGSKVRVDRSVRSLFTSLELPSWRRAFCRYSHGFCAWNTVYSVVGGRLSLLTYQSDFWRSVASINGRIPKFPANFLGRSQ